MIYLPAAFDGKASLPAVIALHGELSSAQEFRDITQLEKTAEANSFILVFPQAVGPQKNNIILGSWNAGSCCYEAKEKNVDDVAFINKVIDDIIERFKVDSQRVYAAGHANGAMMAYRAACELSDKITAIAADNATGYFSQCPLKRSVPTLHHHGMKNDCMPYYGGMVIDMCRNRFLGKAYGYNFNVYSYNVDSVEAFLKKWKGLNQVLAIEKPDYQIGKTRCVSSKEYQKEVLFCTTSSAGHVWPSGGYGQACHDKSSYDQCAILKQIMGEGGSDFDFNQFMWDFFKNYRLDSFALNNMRLESGQYVFEISVDNHIRKYFVYVPENYRAPDPMPVVFNFHPENSNPKEQMELSLINESAETNGFIAVYPEGSSDKFAHQENFSWNAGSCCGYAAQINRDDVLFVRHIIEDLKSKFAIDENRMYATGFSNGAQFAYRLACEAADIITSIAPVGGNLALEKCYPQRGVSILDIKMKEDPCLSADTDGLCGGCFSRERRPCPNIKNHMKKWQGLYSCSQASKAFDMNYGIVEEFFGCQDKARLVSLVVNGAGHVWPGKGKMPLAEEIAGKTVSDPDINHLIWEFFKNTTREIRTEDQIKQVPTSQNIILMHGSVKRQYTVDVPSYYEQATKWPVIIFLHEENNTAESLRSTGEINLWGEKKGFISVYPKALKETWDFHDAESRQVDDAGFIKSVVDDIKNNFPVDEKKIYLVGYSHGALMAYRLLCDMPDIWAASVMIAAHDLPGDCTSRKPVPIMHWHGKNDDVFPYNGGQCAYEDNQQKSCRPVDVYLNQWADLSQCGWETQVIYQKGNATCVKYKKCVDNADIVSCFLDDFSHEWPRIYKEESLIQEGKSSQRLEEDNIMEVIFRFFKKHSLN